MNGEDARNILRYSRLEERARKYREIGRQTGNRARMMRAAALETAAHVRANNIAMANVRPYGDYSDL